MAVGRPVALVTLGALESFGAFDVFFLVAGNIYSKAYASLLLRSPSKKESSERLQADGGAAEAGRSPILFMIKISPLLLAGNPGI